MKNKPFLLVANWKMNPLTLKEADRIIKSLEKGIRAMNKKDFFQKIDLVVCPPSVFLGRLPNSSGFNWGIQNIHWETRGAFTGELSVKMAEDARCQYAIVGHSERRKFFGEKDQGVNQKILSVLGGNLNPILCIGETKEEREQNKTNDVVKNQIYQALQNVSALNLPRIAIAYEPVWAISNMSNPAIQSSNNTYLNTADSPDDVMGVTILIRKILSQMYRSDITKKTKILYGGSVSQRNIDGFLDTDILDGLLIGGASLSMFEFLPIIKSCYENRSK
ncbi:MAG: triosephosphate isomerase [Candidatus Moranbacteria bacterium]|nr:triosephosphate isomerase [Candidatus Moranbacteria bacterium]